MAWRWLRYERLHNPRLPWYQSDPQFMVWFQSIPVAKVGPWGQNYLPALLAPQPPSEALLRLARLRPLPLEILWAWHEAEVLAARAGYAPGQDVIQLEYVVSACLQRLDAYYLRDRQIFRRGQGAQHETADAKSAADVLHGPSSGQLTISDATMRAAEDISTRAVESARAMRTAALDSVANPGPGVSKGRTEGCVSMQCGACESGARPLARSAKNMRYPPFVLGCTCHFAFDWEGEPLSEADYQPELAAWAAHRAKEVPYPFPTRLLLFKLAESAAKRTTS
jgi:hypothetical protein